MSIGSKHYSWTQFPNIPNDACVEHIDDPIQILQRINEVARARRAFFLVCPNANAPSRQIAVKMGLISHNAAVTQAEKSIATDVHIVLTS